MAPVKEKLIFRNTVWLTLTQVIRIVPQAIGFVMLARLLEATGYGEFLGVAALVGIVSPFAGLGGGNILIKNAARNPALFGKYWGNAILLTLLSGTALLLLVIVVGWCILPSSVPLLLVLLIAASDLFLSRLLIISGQAFQAFERLERTAQLDLLFQFCRLAAVVVLIVVPSRHSPVEWGALYLASTAICAGVAIWLVCRELGRPLLVLDWTWGELREGFYFSVSLAASNIYNDIDKTMLTRLSTLKSAGIYGVAYRAIDLAFTPVRSLLQACYARFFQHGESGIRSSLKFALRFLPIAAAYGAAVGIALVVAAPLVPWILGAEYGDTIIALRWLALLPLLKVLHYFAADALTGAGHQGLRSSVQVAVAIFNVLINLWLIPAYSWVGAAWSSLASDGLLALLLWMALARLAMKAN